jgi:hypothetical protein
MFFLDHGISLSHFGGCMKDFIAVARDAALKAGRILRENIRHYQIRDQPHSLHPMRHLSGPLSAGRDQRCRKTANVSYLPWLNTKLALEYSTFTYANGVKERDTNLLVHLYF